MVVVIFINHGLKFEDVVDSFSISAEGEEFYLIQFSLNIISSLCCVKMVIYVMKMVESANVSFTNSKQCLPNV